jgi:hypothetical protein
MPFTKGQMQFTRSPGSPGIHPPTASLTRILAQNEVLNPIDGRPFSEAMLLGIGGGLDTGYILYQFKHLPNPILVLGFRHQWNQTREFLQATANRLKLKLRFQEYANPITAQTALQKTIKTGKPAMVWVDKASLPYRHLPEQVKGFIQHQVTVYQRDGRLWKLYIDDLSSDLIEIREKALTAARANLSQHNFLMMIVEKTSPISKQDLGIGIIEGIQECVIQLTRPIHTIGISNLNTWAQRLANRQDPMGWPRVFKHQKGLFPILCTLYEMIKLNASEGFALRKMYSDFLHEGANVLGNSDFNGAAGQYLQLANQWSNLAENALPSKIPVFDRVKKMLNNQYQTYRRNDFNTYQTITEDLNILAKALEADFPLNAEETSQLFERLSSQVKLIAELELSAARRLRDITRR